MRYQTITLLVAVATLVLTVVLYITIPKGFFPTQDTGIIQGISQAAASTSFDAMTEKQQELAKVLLADPAVESISSFIGPDGTNTTLNSGRIQINLKPLAQRGHLRHRGDPSGLRPKLAKVEGIKLYMQPVQDLTVDDRVSRTQYQYTLEDPNSAELNTRDPRFGGEAEEAAELADVVTDQQLGGAAESLVIDRATASRFGITPQTIDNTLYDAFGQRQINTLYTQLNQYHVILEAEPQFQLDPQRLHDIYIQSSRQRLFLDDASIEYRRLVVGRRLGRSRFARQCAADAVVRRRSLTPCIVNFGAGHRQQQHYVCTVEREFRVLRYRRSSTASANSTVLSSTSTSSSISSSANTSSSGTTRSASASTAAQGSSGAGRREVEAAAAAPLAPPCQRPFR